MRGLSAILDPQWFNLNAYPDLAFIQIADPDSDPDVRIKVLMTKNLKHFTAEFFFCKNCSLILPRSPWKTPKLPEKPSKEKIQHFKTWKFLLFFYFCGLFFPSWIRIRLQKLKKMPIRIRNPDTSSAPDPHGSAMRSIISISWTGFFYIGSDTGTYDTFSNRVLYTSWCNKDNSRNTNSGQQFRR